MSDEVQSPCFLVGSPRSGTTVVGEALGRHPRLAHLYEPYFLWERHAPTRPDDVLTADDVTPAMAAYVRAEFDLFRRRSRADVVLDKSPEHAFRIDAINRIFPEARFIHLLRDGRDVTVSIRREWDRRQQSVMADGVAPTLQLARAMLRRQAFWRNRMQALVYEARTRIRAGRLSLRNKAKWEGLPGWGPRFPGWHDTWLRVDPIVFHALQWRRSVEATESAFAALPAERCLTVRYEDLVTRPDAVLGEIQAFAGVEPGLSLLHNLNGRSTGRWRQELDERERELVHDAIGDKLAALRYA